MKKQVECVVVGDIQTNCWLYPLEDAPDSQGKQPCVVIDPGEEGDKILSRLEKLNWVPHYIFLTHGHFDHVAALPVLLDAFKGASPVIKTGIHREDAHYLGDRAKAVHRDSFSKAGGSPAYVDAYWKDLPDGDIIFEEGATVGPFKIVHVPGHTPGSVALYDEKAGVLFSGDTLFQGDYGRTDLPGGSEVQLFESLKRLLSMDADIVVYPGHGGFTTIKDEVNTFRRYFQ